MTHMTAGPVAAGLWEQREDGVLLTRWGVVEVLLALQSYLVTVPPEGPRAVADARINVLDHLRRELMDAVVCAITPPRADGKDP